AMCGKPHRQSQPYPAQGNDPAVCLLWRHLDARRGLQHGAAAGADAPAARGADGERASRLPEHGYSPCRMSTFVLMAGGTGGHLFPAMALAQELTRRGHVIHLMTDHRVASYGEGFPAVETHIVPSATPSVRDPLKFVAAGFKILWGI